MEAVVVDGDLLKADAEVIVNPWNRNQPWTPDWLARPSGVSGQIKRRGGALAIKELRRTGPMRLGEARWTAAGALPYRGIIHVAGIDNRWRASKASIQVSVISAVKLADARAVRTLAMPVIGAGHGRMNADQALDYIQQALVELGDTRVHVAVVRWSPPNR